MLKVEIVFLMSLVIIGMIGMIPITDMLEMECSFKFWHKFGGRKDGYDGYFGATGKAIDRLQISPN